jgi:hypothetical protein
MKYFSVNGKFSERINIEPRVDFHVCPHSFQKNVKLILSNYFRLCEVWRHDSISSTDDIVQCYGHLITSDHQIYRVTPLKTPVGLLILLLQSSPTRNYIHSQLFITLCHIYTAYNHTRS